MAERTKICDRNLESPYRSVNWTEADSDEGDVLLVRESLGRPASNCTIEVDSVGDGMSVRFNVKRTIYPRIPRREGFMYVDHLPYLPSGEDYTDTTVALVNIEAGSTYSFETGPAVRDVQIVSASGHWDMWFS